MNLTQQAFKYKLINEGSIFLKNVVAVDIQLLNGGSIHFKTAKALIIERLAYDAFDLTIFNEGDMQQVILKIYQVYEILIMEWFYEVSFWRIWRIWKTKTRN